MIDEIRRIALFGSGVAELTRNRAEQIVKDFVKQGDLRREQAQTAVKELMDRNKQNRGELLGLIRAEIRRQVGGLGLATKRDVERLERRVARLESRGSSERSARPPKKTSPRSSAKKTSQTAAKRTVDRSPAPTVDADPTSGGPVGS